MTKIGDKVKGAVASVGQAALRTTLGNTPVDTSVEQLTRACRIESGKTDDPTKAQAYLNVADQLAQVQVPDVLKSPDKTVPTHHVVIEADVPCVGHEEKK